ncbi:MAG: DsrH/TusB family sulfur metabolism protein [Oceanobacter sp.]
MSTQVANKKLHQLSSANPEILSQCLKVAAPEDSLLLLGDALALVNILNTTSSGRCVYARESDQVRYGLSLDQVDLISDQRWVELTLEHQSVLSWS